MAKLDRDALIEQFQKAVDKTDARLNGEKGLVARREKAVQALAALDEKITAVKAERAKAEAGIEWAKSFPGADNAAPVPADNGFGDAVVVDDTNA